MEGRWTTLEPRRARLAIGGTTAPWGKDLARRPVPPADAYLLLSHSPDQVYRADGMGIDLMLCGHNHGGQVHLPIVGPDADAEPVQPGEETDQGGSFASSAGP